MTRPSQNTRDYHRQQASMALDRAQVISQAHDELVGQRRAILAQAIDAHAQAMREAHTALSREQIDAHELERLVTPPMPAEIDTTLLDVAIEDARFELQAELAFAQIQADLALSASGLVTG